MERRVETIVDKYNAMMIQSVSETDSLVRTTKLFKLSAWLTVQLVTLHGLNDGNGRLTRLLGKRVLELVTPFASAVVITSSHRLAKKII
jgi:prophage maintenance system killer protein